MKRWKKFLAGVLTLAMAMSMMTMTAFAAPTIDESKDGEASLTIHKYAQDDPYDPVAGTGKEITGDVPGGKTPLPGATFTIYQLKDIEYIEGLYSGTENVEELPKTADEIKKAYNIYMDSSTHQWKVEGLSSSVKDTAQTKTTDENGEAAFTDLGLGIYLVVETKTPDSVPIPADPFIVSIPMTVDESEWLYDVHAYPKNATGTSGEIKLRKVGKLPGTEGVTNENTFGLEGAQFILQKENADGSWTTITRKLDDKFQDNKGDFLNGKDDTGVLTTDSDGYISVSGLSSGTYRFIEISTVDGYIETGYAVYEVDILGDDYNWATDYSDYSIGIIGPKTWFMPQDGHDQPWQTNATSGGDVPMVVNERPDLEKKVAPKNAPETWEKEAEYSVGDEIPYQITVKVPSADVLPYLSDFNVIDTPTNLKDNIDTIKVTATMGKFYQEALGYDPTWELIKDKDYWVEEQTDGGFKITFNNKNAFLADQEITIEYTATLLDTAVTTTAGNPNTAKLEYTNNIKPGSDPDNPNSNDKPGNNVIEDKTIVYTFQIDVEKVDGEGDPLGAGVVFELYKMVDANESGVLSAEQAKEKGLETVSGKAYKKINVDENGKVIETLKEGESGDLVTNSEGKVSVIGLENGDYWLVETKTLEGYNLLSAPVKVNLSVHAVTDMSTSTEWTENADGTWTLVKTTFNSSTTTFSNNGKGDATIGHATQTVINKVGFTLPSTGGMGTFVFTFVGIAMMAAAVILFITSKKKEAK